MIAIRLVSHAGEAPGTSLEAIFGEAVSYIGRGADCTLVLPDPERRISRKHMQVACRDGQHFLRLISTNLMVELDGVPLAPGVEYALDAGAQIRIGPFVLQADGESTASARPREASAAAPALREPSDPAADDDFALFGSPRQTGRPSVFDDLLHAPQADASADAPAAPADMLHIDLVIGEPTGSGLRPASPAATPDGGAGQLPGSPVPADELIEALYAGLGMAAPEPAARSAAQVELVGALLRASIHGTLELLAARSIAKRELGASPTLLQTRQNNPLKFSPDASAALAQLLGPPKRGFVPPLMAVREAFDDLRAHEVAVLAGMRAALEAVLTRFNPEALELRLAAKGMWDNLLPVNYKAKLWERYGEQHAEIVREIEENFDSVFAGAFLEAYEAQLARLTD
ncbi:type VI secretion system-associated FHA domain protein TagH [Piscinibacter sp.]|uniref:type VI secretion system-associated FHA domain protein TagH n=1 Tax=Piscinibacter sp. TaxID=1903157 RepID=UPI002F411736